MDLKQLTLNAIDIAKNAGSYIRKYITENKQRTIEEKWTHNYVTEVDKNSEDFLVNELKKLLPESGFITEEKKREKSAVYNWIIDPLDGTTNFIHNLYPVSISIALQKNNQTILGIVYEIGNDEVFYAYEGAGAFLNNKKIQVSATKKISDSLLATGFPVFDYSRLDNFIETLKYFMQHTHGLRRLGSAATDLAYVAAGRFDGFYEYSLKVWDVAAGEFIVRQAGGKSADFQGGDNFLYGEEIIASNPFIFNEFVKIIKKIMYG